MASREKVETTVNAFLIETRGRNYSAGKLWNQRLRKGNMNARTSPLLKFKTPTISSLLKLRRILATKKPFFSVLVAQ
jgi:hypothetical protein